MNPLTEPPGSSALDGGTAGGDGMPDPPIRISRDGERILTGSGDIYEADGFTRSGGLPADLPGELVDALWLPDGGVVTLRRVLHDDFSSTTVFERRTAALDLAEAVEYAGAPIGLVETAAGLVVIISGEVRVSFHIDHLGDD
jgi:hypothetical protein